MRGCTIRIGRSGRATRQNPGSQHLFLVVRVAGHQLCSTLQAFVGVSVFLLIEMAHACRVLCLRKSDRSLLECILVFRRMGCRLDRARQCPMGSLRITSIHSPLAGLEIRPAHQRLHIPECLCEFGALPNVPGGFFQLRRRALEVPSAG